MVVPLVGCAKLVGASHVSVAHSTTCANPSQAVPKYQHHIITTPIHNPNQDIDHDRDSTCQTPGPSSSSRCRCLVSVDVIVVIVVACCLARTRTRSHSPSHVAHSLPHSLTHPIDIKYSSTTCVVERARTRATNESTLCVWCLRIWATRAAIS